MLDRFLLPVVPAKFSDPSNLRIYNMLVPIATGIGIILGIDLIIGLLANTNWTQLFLGPITGVVTCSLTCVIAYRGNARGAASFFVFSGWLALAASSYYFDGIQSAQLIHFSSVVLLAYVLLGTRVGNGITVATMIWIALLLIGSLPGYQFGALAQTTNGNEVLAYILALSLLANVTILRVATQQWRNSLLRAEAISAELKQEITQRTHAEAALKETNDRIEQLASNISDAFWLVELAPLKLLYISPAYSTIMGTAMTGDITIEEHLQYVVAEDRDGYLATMASIVDNPSETTECEYRINSHSGETKWLLERSWPIFDDAGKPTRHSGVIIDITERKRHEKLQSATVDKLQHIIDNIPARIAYFDPEHRYLFVNKQYAPYNITAQDIGRKIYEVAPPETRASIKEHMDRALAGEAQEFDLAMDNSIESKRKRTVFYVPHVVEDEVVGVLTASWDVTERQRSEAALWQTQKLESLGILAGGIAHDFNNLLVAMLGQTSLAQIKLPEEHAARRHVDKAVNAAERASILTQQMLAYSGRGQFEIRPINLNELIQENSHLFKASITKSVQIRLNLTPTLGLIEADTAQMQQVIMNLIINAAQAIGSKPGLITITTTNLALAENDSAYWQYTGNPMPAGQYAAIEVQDDGVGMDKGDVKPNF